MLTYKILLALVFLGFSLSLKLRQGCHIIYTVEIGDTLYKIARKFSISIEKLIRYNNIIDRDFIEAGATLKIPCP
jgi:spore germination protein YaaH